MLPEGVFILTAIAAIEIEHGEVRSYVMLFSLIYIVVNLCCLVAYYQ